MHVTVKDVNEYIPEWGQVSPDDDDDDADADSDEDADAADDADTDADNDVNDFNWRITLGMLMRARYNDISICDDHENCDADDGDDGNDDFSNISNIILMNYQQEEYAGQVEEGEMSEAIVTVDATDR